MGQTDTKLYKVAVTLGGNYVHGRQYDVLTQVFYAREDGGDGKSYVSRRANKNVRPGTDTTVWQLVSDTGDPGTPAGFGTPTVSFDETQGGIPSVDVAASGPDTEKVFDFSFHNIKGTQGNPGEAGKSPIIGQNGNWFIYDNNTDEYIDSGKPSRGEDGLSGLAVEDVEDTEDVEEGLAAVVLRKTPQALTSAEKAQVKSNLDIPDSMTTDATPTQNSANPVQSGGVFSALAGKTDPTPVANSQPQSGMLPNVFYDFGELASNTTFTLDTVNVSANVLNHYFWQFGIGSTVPVVTFPAAITAWYGGSAPIISENKTYQISVIDGLGVAAEF